jgi:tRNA threonylcarbamoyladenosine biosynthesis protein TsaE
MEQVIKNEEDLQNFTGDFIKNIEPHKDRAFVVGLSGDLGSGKTTFVQKIASFYEVKEKVTSPTFVLEKIYHLHAQKFEQLIHIDAYRIEESQELKTLDWYEIIKDSQNIIFIEWPERVKDTLSEVDVLITFKYIDEKKRAIICEYGGK